jgi:hypothetical protein
MQQPRVQIPVLKQGTLKKAQWSTRVLTIDVATATVTVSRHNHPNNVLYHSLRVNYMQMWPRFPQSLIACDFTLLEAKLTLHVVGEHVAVPSFAASANTQTTAAVTGKGADSSAGPSSPAPSASSATTPDTAASPYSAFTWSDSAKRSRSLTSSMNWLADAWLIQFTSFDSYEMAVRLLLQMRNKESVRLRELCPYVEGDLKTIRKAWEHQHSIIEAPTSDVKACAG